MATINIKGFDKPVTVSDNFLQLSPEQQQETVNDIARRLAAGVEQPAQNEANVSTGTDVVQSLGRGLTQGAIGVAGLPGDIGQGMLAVADFINEQLGLPKASETAARVRDSSPFPNVTPTSQQITEGVESVAGEFEQPQTTAGEFAQTIGQFAPGALAPGSTATRIASSVLPAVASETAGQAARVAAPEQEGLFRVGAAIAAPFGLSALTRAATPLTSPKPVREAARRLEKEGVTSITAGQKTDSRAVRALESEAGGAAAAAVVEKGKRQFTAAALSRVGVPKDKALAVETFEDLAKQIDEAFTRNSSEFQRLTKNNNMKIDKQALGEAEDALEKYLDGTTAATRNDRVQKIASELVEIANQPNRVVSGELYQRWRSALGRVAKALRASSPDGSSAIRDLQATLDAAMERSIRAVNKTDAGKFKEVRRMYRDLLIVENAAVRAGQDAASGMIGPKQLRGAALQVAGKRQFARGKNDMANLGRDGELVVTDLPDSGTANRFRAQNLGFGLTALGGGVVGGSQGGLEGALIGAAAPFAAGRLAVSGPGRRFLGNTALQATREAFRPGQAAIVGGGLAAQANR